MQESVLLRELAALHAAWTYFTRVPLPGPRPFRPDDLGRATKYFAIIGIAIGGLLASAALLVTLRFPTTVAAWVTLALGLMLTGAFHEDGLADFSDGMGGGTSRPDILRIMRDSRLGTFGTSALIVSLGLRVACLDVLLNRGSAPEVFGWVVASHAASRALAASVVFHHSYVREDDDAKAKPVANTLSVGGLIVLAVSGIGPALTLTLSWSCLALSAATLARVATMALARRRLGGYTGDVLGAIQQTSELAFLSVGTVAVAG